MASINESWNKLKSLMLYAKRPSEELEKIPTMGTNAPETGDTEYQTSDERRTIGPCTAVFLIFNRMIGTGIFATPSAIFSLTNSVGLSLLVWVVGAVIAGCGMAVYLEFGTAIPRNGGEKNYLEYVYSRPRYFTTCVYSGYAMLLGWAGSNSVVFGEYILHAAGASVNRWNQRAIGFGCLTFCFLIHGTCLKWGMRLQNMLGIIKLLVIFLIAVMGFVALAGHMKIDKPHNFSGAFDDVTNSPYAIVAALYNVIWSYLGYNNANYAMSEMRKPVRTLKIAGPLALGLVAIMYIFCNIAYFAAVPKDEIANSGRVLAATFFQNVFGRKAERVLSVFIALSAFGNVLSVIFSQGRLVQELGREGIIPLSRFFSSNRPFNAPLSGLFEHWVVSLIIMLAPPPGDAYNFMLNVISYPVSVVNLFMAGGLIYLYRNPVKYQWRPSIRATLPVVCFFFISNLYLVVCPFIPPQGGQNVYEHLPYYLHCVVAIGILLAGGLYWAIWAKILPRFGRFTWERTSMLDRHGWTRNYFVKVLVK